MGTGQSKTDFTQFGMNLKKARDEAGLTQGALAKIIGKDKNTIGNYERNSGKKGTVPNLETVCAIADALNTSIDRLVGREKEKPKETHSVEMDGGAFLSYLIDLLQSDMVQHKPICFPIPGSDETNYGIEIKFYGEKAYRLNKELDDFIGLCDYCKRKMSEENAQTTITGFKTSLLNEFGDVFTKAGESNGTDNKENG